MKGLSVLSHNIMDGRRLVPLLATYLKKLPPLLRNKNLGIAAIQENISLPTTSGHREAGFYIGSMLDTITSKTKKRATWKQSALQDQDPRLLTLYDSSKMKLISEVCFVCLIVCLLLF
jgi:hypothetical protein